MIKASNSRCFIFILLFLNILTSKASASIFDWNPHSLKQNIKLCPNVNPIAEALG